MVDIGQAYLDGRRAQAPETGDRDLDGLGDARLRAGAEILARQTDPNAGEGLCTRVCTQEPGVVLGRPVDAGRVAAVVAGHGVEQQRAVFGGLAEGARRIEARRKSDQPVAGANAVGRFQSADAG